MLRMRCMTYVRYERLRAASDMFGSFLPWKLLIWPGMKTGRGAWKRLQPSIRFALARSLKI